MKRPPAALLLALGLLLAAASVAPAAESVNKTTSTAEKKSELIKEGEDSFLYRCPGLAGYSVLHEGAHGRSWINFVYDSEQTDLMDPILNAAGGAWGNKADDTLIWRGTMQDGDFVPYACILRMAASSDEGQPVETFVIIQLAGAGSHVVGQVPAKKGMAAAEALADKLAKME